MRIVYVLTSLGMGGAERQVVALASRMAGRGHAVALMVLRPPLAEQWPTDLTVFHLGMRKNPASIQVAMVRGRRFLAEFHPDVVHSHSFHANIAARLLKILLPSLTVVSTVHNVYEGGWVRMLTYRLTNRLARITTAVSQAAADRFVHLKAVSREKCIVVPNGIDSDDFAPSRARREQARAAMDVEKEFVWLTAGRIVPGKDYPNLLRAFQRVLAARQDARLWVAGTGEKEELSRVRAMAAGMGLDHAVRWLRLRRDMPALLDAADGFALGSAWEGMPLSVGEAMAMAKPVVCTDVGGVRELVGDGGALVPSKDPDALADAMLDVMRLPPEDRQALGCATRARILRDFSMDAKTKEWEALYQMALAMNDSRVEP
jgi:glycosyltransferase involved in cell wall biosynthesis